MTQTRNYTWAPKDVGILFSQPLLLRYCAFFSCKMCHWKLPFSESSFGQMFKKGKLTGTTASSSTLKLTAIGVWAIKLKCHLPIVYDKFWMLILSSIWIVNESTTLYATSVWVCAPSSTDEAVNGPITKSLLDITMQTICPRWAHRSTGMGAASDESFS